MHTVGNYRRISDLCDEATKKRIARDITIKNSIACGVKINLHRLFYETSQYYVSRTIKQFIPKYIHSSSKALKI